MSEAMTPTVFCPTCTKRVVLLLPTTRGIEHVSKPHRCHDLTGRQVASVFRLSRHPKGGTTTLSITSEYPHD